MACCRSRFRRLTSTFITKGLLTHLDNNAPEAVGFLYSAPAGSLIYLSKNPTSNWTASTNLTEVSGRVDLA